MPKRPAITPKKLLKLLIGLGFEIDHVTGSHHILFHPETRRRVTIPLHTRDIPKGTLGSIMRSADVSWEDLEKKA